jgi:glycine/D-amino acid oxidase-like deaminating enzyme
VNFSKRIAVIGGGTLGSLIALRLSNLGLNVELFESKPELLKGASYLGEGKIHLGYTYGLSQESSYEQLVESALTFADDVQGAICKPIDWKNITSIPFSYKVVNDSLLSPDEFINHGKNIINTIKQKEHLKTYLGLPVEKIMEFERTSERSFTTSERAVDLEKLREIIIVEIIARENITINVNSEILLVKTDTDNKYILSTNSGKLEKRFDYIINCTWEKRHLLDQMFWDKLPDLNYRTKLYVSAKTSLQETACTTVLGKYGDLVIFNTGRLYGSDYRTGLTSFTNEVLPNFTEKDSLPEELVTKHWEYLKSRFLLEVPELSEVTDITTFERSIVAQGDSDIDQINSGLHDRSPYYLNRKGNYISALGTKMTTIPQLAKKIVDWISLDGFK